jgi:tetratricopeptide (TPR) repeat protein
MKMDPITCAARRLFAEMDVFWEAAEERRTLRITASDEDRSDLVKALRLFEASPENRRPMFLYEAPFIEPRGYFTGLCDRIAQDYELVRKGAAEEGVMLPPFAVDERMLAQRLSPIGRAVLHMERAATLLGERLDGVLVALVPPHVGLAGCFRECVATLAKALLSTRVHLAVVDRPNGPLESVLGATRAHFEIDQAKLLAHKKQLISQASGGPATDAQPAPTKTQELASLLLDAAESTRQGGSTKAMELYRRAIVLCRAEDLMIEEACVRMALAGACLAAGEAPAALESYRKAAELGEKKKAFPITCQAWLGAAGICFTFKRYQHAATAYESAAEAARRAPLPLLRVEALRMAGTCHLLRGSEEDALLAWIGAVSTGVAMNSPERKVSTLAQAAEALSELLNEVGLSKHAADVASYIRSFSAERRGSACL